MRLYSFVVVCVALISSNSFAESLRNRFLVVESDERWSAASLPDATAWDIREYPPAIVAIRQTESDAATSSD